jgi:hypothetical protein
MASLFVHSTTAVVLALLCFKKMILSFMRSKRSAVLVAVVPGVVFALCMTIFRASLRSVVEDRRLADGYIVGGGSLLQMTFFIILIVVQLRCDVPYIKKHGLVIGLLAWYLALNPFVPWAYRIWAAGMPLIGYSIWDLPPLPRKGIICLWISYTTLYYCYWTKLFNFWYGA